jgi:uncharacterized protein DUF4118
VLQIVTGLFAVALITFICFPAERLIIPSLLYLIVVVLESLWGGFLCSAIVSVLAAACLEYFFIPPVLQWQIDDPDDILALLTYLATSLIITRLASKARNQARVAERRRKDISLLYEVASRLLSLGPEMAAGPESLRIFRDVFGLQAVCLFDLESAPCRLREVPPMASHCARAAPAFSDGTIGIVRAIFTSDVSARPAESRVRSDLKDTSKTIPWRWRFRYWRPPLSRGCIPTATPAKPRRTPRPRCCVPPFWTLSHTSSRRRWQLSSPRPAGCERPGRHSPPRLAQAPHSPAKSWK